MALHIDQWEIEGRPWGWFRLREASGSGPAVYLHYTYSGPSGGERLDLREVVMRAGASEPLSARTWRRIPLLVLEKLLTAALRLASNAPTESSAMAGAEAIAMFNGSGVEAPSLDQLDDYFAATADISALFIQPMSSDMLISDGADGLPEGRLPRIKPPEGRLTDDFLKDVGDVYLWAAGAGQSPAPAIAAMADVPVRTVHRWVYEARKRGILPPARSGRAG